MTTTNYKLKGAVSIFVVIFATLLITIVTVSFATIMIRDQQQAAANDLSQSAYDSAQAGVEDGKRALLRYQNACTTGTPAECQTYTKQIIGTPAPALYVPTCTDAVTSLNGVNISGNEVMVKTATSGDEKYDQAYTCVKIKMDTPDYLGILKKDNSKLVQLKGMLAFDTIKIEWSTKEDLGGNTTVSLPVNTDLSSDWSSAAGRPALMKAQLIQFSNSLGFLLNNLDDSIATNASSNTLYLYPSSSIPVPSPSFSNDSRSKTLVNNSLKTAKCEPDITAKTYACSQLITLPIRIDSDRTAYLNLTSFYRDAHYRVVLWDSTAVAPNNVVNFSGIQPEIDSTGRANDLFRRVKARVEMVDVNFPYPEAAIDTTGNLCKDFSVTDNAADYVNTCTP